MKRKDDGVVRAFQRLASAAEEFVNRASRVKRIQAQRSALLDAITDAQLMLSVHRLPQDKEPEPKPATKSKSTALLEEQMQKSKATLTELGRLLLPLRVNTIVAPPGLGDSRFRGTPIKVLRIRSSTKAAVQPRRESDVAQTIIPSSVLLPLAPTAATQGP